MKLLLVPDPTSPEGQDAFCREIAKRAEKRGHETRIEAVPNGPLEATLAQLAATGFGHDADFVVINSLQPAALLAAKAAGRRAAVRLIDSYVAAPPQALQEVRELVLKADLVLVPSRHLADIIKSWGLNGSVKQVPYAYDRIMAQQIALVTMRASKPIFQIVAAGPLNEATRPGFEILLSALSRLRIDCHLNVIGDGPALASLKARAQQYVIADKVSFMGAMPHAKLMEFFRASKAYVDPCALEGYPALTLHALSEGCPVIVARAGAATELIRDGENGLLFTPGDAVALSESIVTLWSVRGLSLRLIAEGIKTVGSHSWDSTVDALFQAVEGAMILAVMLDTDDSVDFPGNDGTALGRPLATYPLMAAKASGRVERAYAVTASPPVKSAAVQYGAVLVDPPGDSGPYPAESLLRHAWKALREEHQDLSTVEFVLVFFANAPAVTGALINQGIEALQGSPEADSAVSVSPLNRWNPFHAQRQGEQGLLEPYVVAAPQTGGEVLYPDWSLQVLRPRCLEASGAGRPPFPWLGAKVLPVKQWGAGPIDYQWQIPSLEYWLKKHGVTDSSAGPELQPKPQLAPKSDRR